MIRSYSDAVKLLEKYIPTSDKKHPGKFGLTRMKNLAGLLGNPQDSYKTIHVGGTSGKGSTATIITSILATKYKVGLHTSPHLVRVNERFQVYSYLRSQRLKLKTTSQKLKLSIEISNHDFIDLVNEIMPAVKKMERSKTGAPSYFEIVTAMSFLYFKKQKVDFGVIETGMGGSYDATNIIHPETAVITNVGLDHTEVLGETVEEIARDKAGIIKPGVKAVTGVKQPAVIKILESRCKIYDSRVSLLGKDFRYKINKIDDKGSYLDYWGKRIYKNLFIPLPGVYQAENAALAVRTAEELGVEEEDIRSGLKQSYIPGRMEIVRRRPLTILDGAHNPDKIRALAGSFDKIWKGKKIVLVLAVKKEKNAGKMLEVILPVCKKVYLTEYKLLTDQGVIESYKPQDLSKMIEKTGYKGQLKIIMNPQEAYKKAIGESKEEDIILATGSLYLIGEIKKSL